MYDHELTLISVVRYQNEIGEWVTAESKSKVLCEVKSVGRNEFYNAAVSGLKPTAVFVLHAYEYAGQQSVEFEGARYKVLRTYATDFEEVELTCERTTGGTSISLIDTELVRGLKGLIEQILSDEGVVMDEETRDAYTEQLTVLLARWTP